MKASSELVKLFEDSGFVLVRWKGPHLFWRCPKRCGRHSITSCKTPGKGRSIDNARGDIARTLRACGQQRSAT